MSELTVRLAREFRERYQAEPLLVVAPGRINLMGEHVDYNEGYVLPGAIDKHLVFAVATNDSGKVDAAAVDFNESASFSLSELEPGHGWKHYFMGVIAGFRNRGIDVPGISCVFGGTIPAGAGLSSSAALCCGFGFALNELTKAKLPRLDLALIAQYAEHEFAHVKCGLMDQYASLFGKESSLLLLDCRSNTHTVVNFPSQRGTLLLADTKVKHSLASSAYNARRAACEEGVVILRKEDPTIKSLRDVSIDQLVAAGDAMSREVFTRCRYIVEEIARTRQAAAALEEDDLDEVGRLMFRTHDGLRNLFDVSCAELDVLVDAAAGHPELVIGSRLMGGGFGGCTINLVRPGKEESFKALVSTKYFASFNTTPEFYPVTLAQGTHRENA
jgi:galactokinase